MVSMVSAIRDKLSHRVGNKKTVVVVVVVVLAVVVVVAVGVAVEY